jgi:EAL domain-containing protein (putative c-di-GMP-specific phosphodiesterase class I)
LRRFPFDKVKIDRSFIHDLGAETDDSSIILAIIGLAERMNMKVTAEGVETCAQMRLLRMYHCPQGQGFLFSRPVPAEAFAALVAADNRDFGCDE